MPTHLSSIRKFTDLVRYLESELEWPVDAGSFDDLTFEYQPAELGLKDEDAVKIKKIHQLRPLVSGQPWGVFFVDFEKKKLPVVVLRRILSHLVVKKRQSAYKADQAVWNPEDLLFISAFGDETSDQREIAFAHFHQQAGDLPTLRVLGWDGGDTPLKLDFVAGELQTKLHWPKNPKDQNAWRTQWSGAFRHKLGHTIKTADALAEVLAALARHIRDAAKRLMKAESESGPLTKLYQGFQTALIHDLKPDDFADTYAQTITYGLLTAAISRTEMSEGARGTVLYAENVTDMVPVTNPFLKEMLQTFLKAGGRKGGIDFDELGIQDVVELLRGDETDLPAILRDFGNKTRGEDPVIHFYEHFLSAYNKQLKIQRGVFYTPQPVVSYIVRSVHELLQTEFGLEDGLASTATWGEMVESCRRRGDESQTSPAAGKKSEPPHVVPYELKIPDGVKPTEMFVQILDPATGTATFLVEVIDVIHRTLTAKWDQGGLKAMPKLPPTSFPRQPADFGGYWNQYVPLALLPRLHGYELMMAPYAIAHMKIGLKLHETGYHFGTEERARIYLTNALEPKVTQLPQIGFDALAHEAAAVNEIKWYKRFTVVIGNPPYSNFGQLNKIPFLLNLLEDYKRGLNEKKINLDDDFIKFVRLSQYLLDETGRGVFGMITNNVFIDGITHRRMRESLKESFIDIRILDLHGSTKKLEETPDGKTDENVFDIQQGVGISLFVKPTGASKSCVSHAELWGTRTSKYDALAKAIATSSKWQTLESAPPHHFFVPKNFDLAGEYTSAPALSEIFPEQNAGIQTKNDGFVYAMSRAEIEQRISDLKSERADSIARKYDLSLDGHWDLHAAKEDIRKNKGVFVQVLNKPFDKRWTYYTAKTSGFMARPRAPVMRCGLIPNRILLTVRNPRRGNTDSFFVADTIVDKDGVSPFDNATVFPLFLPNDDSGQSALIAHNQLNLGHNFLVAIRAKLGLRAGDGGLPDGVTPEDIFHYAYGVFHSPGYRSRYAEFLKIDFPRLPLTGKLELFRALARLGGELTALHLLESPVFDHVGDDVRSLKSNPGKESQSLVTSSPTIPKVEFIGGRSPEVEKVSFTRSAAVPAAGSRGVPPRVSAGDGTPPKPAGEDACATGTVWLDKAQTTGFQGVREDVWNFHIGGYQVCEKWLKDRKGRTLSAADREHYQKIVVALSETIRLMKEIDAVIEKHGGWPLK